MAKLLKQSKTLEFYLEDFMEHCTLNELSRKTLNSYESILQLIFKYLKEEYIVNMQLMTRDIAYAGRMY